jgi:hypothetical protein
VTYILENTRDRLFYRTSYDLEQYLKRTYPQRTVYIGFNDTNYFITPDTFGYTGCVGIKSTSSKTENHEINRLFTGSYQRYIFI